MVFFITALRAMAACLITNAHYGGIYPLDILANGGLIGDIIFFAVSGYCLYNIKLNFLRWYGKRLWRIYLPVLIITGLYLILGNYSLDQHPINWWLIYPTYYHFVASIVVLYIPFYFVCKIEKLRNNIGMLMAALAVVILGIYMFLYDKNIYHIDVVREPFIRLLFMESMLLGAYFKRNEAKFKKFSKKTIVMGIGAVISFVVYFASKLIFSRYPEFSQFQLINWITIFILLYFVLGLFAGLDEKLNKLPKVIKNVISFVASITLEIYLVQYVIIDAVVEMELMFPLNWLLVTGLIIVSAYVLHLVCKCIYSGVDKTIDIVKVKMEKK